MNDATASKQAGRGINPDEITKVWRVQRKNGSYQFTATLKDNSLVVVRNKATRPYTHMAINSWPSGEKKFLSFHSTPNPSKTYRTLTIEKVLPIEEPGLA
jgi:tRNA splicing ligase